MDIETIKKRIAQLEKLQQEVKINKEMLKGELENDQRYIDASTVVKEATGKRKQIRDEILAHGPNQEIVARVKEDTEEIVTLKEILSAELMEYYSVNKSDEVVDGAGQTRKFVVNVKLLPKRFMAEQ